MNVPGQLIVVEGIDGSGSSTQAVRLASRLREAGRDVVCTAEPTKGPIGTMIRQVLSHRLVVPGAEGPRAPDWRTMALLFAADRADHADSLLRPALQRGQWIVSDRYFLSSLAYQSLTSPEGGAALPWLRALNQTAVLPSLTVVLQISAPAAARRRVQRGEDAELFEVGDLQERLARAYSAPQQLIGEGALAHPIALIDAEPSPDVVERDLVAAVSEALHVVL